MKVTRRQLQRLLEAEVSSKDIKKVVTESLEKIGFYDKYSYGLDDVTNKTKAHDDIIGHT